MVSPRLLVIRPSEVTGPPEAAAPIDSRIETLAAEHRRLRRVLDRIDGLLDAVSGVLVESTSRAAIERRVPSTIVDEAGYPAAWLGTLDPDDSELRLSASSGLPEPISEPTPISNCPSAVGAVVETDTLQCCSADNVSDETSDETSDEASDETNDETSEGDGVGGVLDPSTVGAGRLLVVPLCSGERRYGLLGVYGTETTALDHREQAVFDSLGGMIATGLRAVEASRTLTTDHVTELRIELRDDSFRLSRVAAAVDAPVERCGTTKTADGDCVLYLTTEATRVDPDYIGALPFAEAGRVVSATETESTLSVRLSTVPPDDVLATFGAVVTELSATAEGAMLTVELPPQREVRTVLEALRAAYDTVDLRARTDRERRTRSHEEFVAAVADRLTDRQQTAIEAAHHNGYFESPRPVDGSEIAANMGVTRQTFHQHLRAAERKLVEAYVETS